MLEIKVDGGVIRYKLPNFAEAWRLRACIGEAPKGADPSSWGISRVAQHLGELVDFSGVNVEGSIMDDPRYSDVIMEVIGKIVMRAVEFYPEKKQNSKK